jgi:hypothetical protein
MNTRPLVGFILVACTGAAAALWWGTQSVSPNALGPNALEAPESRQSTARAPEPVPLTRLETEAAVREAETPAAPEPAPSPSNPLPSAQAPSNEALITELLTKVREDIRDPDEKQAVVSTLLFQSIATILDRQGRYQLLRTDGSSPFQSGDDGMVLMANGRQYTIQKGEFPEYDAFLAKEKEKQVWYKEMAKGTTYAPMPTLSEETIQAIEMRAAQALGQ